MAEADAAQLQGDTEGDAEKQAAAHPRKHDEQHAAALDKVTDYVEEQLITGDVGKVGTATCYWRLGLPRVC